MYKDGSVSLLSGIRLSSSSSSFQHLSPLTRTHRTDTANMSDWVGPNLYRIECYKDRKAAIAVKDGTNVVVKYRD